MLGRIGIGAVLVAAGALSAQTLRGSPASVDLMYSTAHAKDLAFLKTPGDVYSAVGYHELALISVTNDLDLEGVKYPFVLPNTRKFTDELAAAYHAACGQRLVVTSGVRPLDEQPRNASPKSVHPTGMAVDFRKPTGACLTWLRARLLTLEDSHVIEATEERRPPHFHVAVLNQAPESRRAMVASARAPASRGASNATSSSGEVAKQAERPAGGGGKEKQYRVRAGDNLWTIAQRTGTTVKEIQSLNDFRTTRLRVGQLIALP